MAETWFPEQSSSLYINVGEMRANYKALEAGIAPYGGAVLPDGDKNFPSGYFQFSIDPNLSGHSCIWPVAPNGMNYVQIVDDRGQPQSAVFCGDTNVALLVGAKLFAIHGAHGLRLPVATFIAERLNARQIENVHITPSAGSGGAVLALDWDDVADHAHHALTVQSRSFAVALPALPTFGPVAMPGPEPIGIGLASIVAAILAGRLIWRRTAQLRAHWIYSRQAASRGGAGPSPSSADAYRLKLLLLLQTLLGPSDDAAEGALHELHTRGNSIDWNPIIPDRLPMAARESLLRILRQLGGTTFLAEARNALAIAQKILSDNGATWRGAEA